MDPLLKHSPEPMNEPWFLRELAEKTYKDVGHTAEGQQTCVRLRRIADMLETAQSALSDVTREHSQERRWIPVNQALPQDKPGMWLTFDAETKKISVVTTLPSWWNVVDGRGREFDGPRVTHWQPTPEAPK